MMHAPRCQTTLCNFEPPALTQQQVIDRHPHVSEGDFSMADRRVVVAKRGQRTQHFDTRRVFRHQDLGLLKMSVRVVGIALAHDDKNLAALVRGTRDKPLMAVQHPLIAFSSNIELNIGRVTGGDLRLRHGVGRANFSREQWRQPLGLLRLGPELHEHFHVSGIGRITVEYLRRPDDAAHLLRQWRIVQKAHTAMIAVLGILWRDK